MDFQTLRLAFANPHERLPTARLRAGGSGQLHSLHGGLRTVCILRDSESQQQHDDAEDMAHVAQETEDVHLPKDLHLAEVGRGAAVPTTAVQEDTNSSEEVKGQARKRFF
eukprot:scaffold3_cov273-Pinguiococcus_pyrenoidosus.AAC.7